jgi:hypothetical protein
MVKNRTSCLLRLFRAGVLAIAIVVATIAPSVASAEPTSQAKCNAYDRWQNGLGRDTTYFPIAVWLQDPRNAPKYQAIGVNLYVALWKGPTPEQITELRRHGMPVICEQNEYALKHLDEKTIVGWMHGDEPDNAQSLGKGKGYGPPILPEKIVAAYRKIRENDPSRAVLLNLGQGVAWDGWYGRGVRTNHPEDYAEYVRGGDIVSFDIYPAVHDRPAVAGKLWYVARGVQRLRGWAGSDRIVWNCIECTRISNTKTKPTPRQVKAEVWMSIIHGSRGIIYFCHQFQPRFIEAGLLADEELARAVGAINRQIRELAPVINGPAVPDVATVTITPPDVSAEMARLVGPRGIALSARQYQGAVYLFAVRMEAADATGKFQVAGLRGESTIQVLGEDRTLRARDGQFEDDFAPHAVHLYKIHGAAKDAEVSFIPEMSPLTGMDVPENAHQWTYDEKARLAEDIRRAAAQWKVRIPEVKEQTSAEKVRLLSRWAKTQMEGYKAVPDLARVVLQPYGADADRRHLVLEGTIDTLPTHSPLVTRWLKVYVLYDLQSKSIARITITIRGERLE